MTDVGSDTTARCVAPSAKPPRINGIVAGAGVALVADHLRAGPHVGFPLLLGVATAVVFIAGFFAYQRWRYDNARPRG